MRQVWIGLGIIVGSIALAAFAITYYTGHLAAQAVAIAQDRATMQQQTESVSTLASLEHSVSQASQYQTAMDLLMSDQYGTVGFGTWFSQVAKQYGVTANAQLQGDSVAEPQGTSPGAIGFAFDAEGSPSGLASFLDAASTKSPGFLISITSFDYTNTPGGGAKVVGNGTVFFR